MTLECADLAKVSVCLGTSTLEFLNDLPLPFVVAWGFFLMAVIVGYGMKFKRELKRDEAEEQAREQEQEAHSRVMEVLWFIRSLFADTGSRPAHLGRQERFYPRTGYCRGKLRRFLNHEEQSDRA